MAIDIQNISVLSYNECEVFVKGQLSEYRFGASVDGETPTVVIMPLSEVQFIQSNTNAFNTGYLTFEEEEKEELFKMIRIKNWKEILTNEQIRKIILTEEKEGLQKIINITNEIYFERVRVILFKLIQDGERISSRVVDTINYRYEELRRRKKKSDLKIITKEEPKEKEYDDLKAQNMKLQSQIGTMQEMMKQLMTLVGQNTTQESTPTATVPVSEKTEVTEEENVVKRKVGRPKKTV